MDFLQKYFCGVFGDLNSHYYQKRSKSHPKTKPRRRKKPAGGWVALNLAKGRREKKKAT
jgi:hypothetical protein